MGQSEMAFAANPREPYCEENKSILYGTPGIDLCICSYRRPEIVNTLAALSRQTGIEQSSFHVIVADNTLDGEAREIVLGAAETLHLNLSYVHAPANNISIARNACLDAARGEWIAFLDDDELPEPHWLAALLAEVRNGGWDAVVGPVKAVYSDEAPQWMRLGSFHSTYPVWVRDNIETAYSGNVIFRRNLQERFGLRFRVELGTTGGEDEDFFYRFRDVGGRIGFAATAIAYEHVEPQRANMWWLLRRNFRAGQSFGSRLRARKSIMGSTLIAAMKCLICAGGAVIALDAVGRARYLTRASLHGGVVARLLGLGEIKMY